MKRWGKGLRALAGGLVAAAVLGLLSLTALARQADDTCTDEVTYTKYSDSLGSASSTRYDGRIWTDKSVTAEDTLTFGQTAGGGAVATIQKGDSDFLVTYSALSSSTETDQTTPVDVVFVLDFSASMN